MKFRNAVMCAACAALLPILPSCLDTVNTAENAETHAVPSNVDLKHVVTDDFLKSRLEIISANSAVSEGGFLKVQVTARSQRTGFWSWLIQGNKPYKLAYKFVWIDSKGMAIDTAASGNWIERDCLPGDIVRFSSTAPNESCKDFQLMLREMPNP